MSVSMGDPTIFDFLGDWIRYWKYSRESNKRLRELMPDRTASLTNLQAEYDARLERVLACALQDEAAALVPDNTTLRMADVLQFRRRHRH